MPCTLPSSSLPSASRTTAAPLAAPLRARRAGWTDIHEMLRALVSGCYLLAFLVNCAFAAGLTLPVVTSLCWLYDYACGIALQSLLFALSLLGFVNELQVRTLFNAAFQRGLRYADLMVSIPQKAE